MAMQKRHDGPRGPRLVCQTGSSRPDSKPVMFLVWLSAVTTSVLAVASIFGVQDAGVPTYYVVAIAVILWLTDLFSNFAEALPRPR